AERSAAIPSPESNDSDDVTTALETANALWGVGDRNEAIRWLRRAAEAAEQAGDDLRSVKLARAAADLTSELQAQLTPPPPAAEPSMPPPPPRRAATPPP